MNRNILLLGGLLARAFPGALYALTSPLFAADVKPTDAAAAAPSIKYHSAFERYRPFHEEPLADWRALNEEVAGVGGHAGIMRGDTSHAGAAGNSSGTPAGGVPQAPLGSANRH
jgi:hypothetical protein